MIAHLQALMSQAKKEGLRMQDIFAMEAEEELAATPEDDFDPREMTSTHVPLRKSKLN